MVVGLLIAVVSVVVESISAYFVISISGIFMGIGMIVLLFFSLVRTIRYLRKMESRRQRQEMRKRRKQMETMSLQKAQEEAQKQAELEAQQQAQEEAAAAQTQQNTTTYSSDTSDSQQNTGGTVYWTPNGEVYHSTKDCPSLGRSKTILSGSISESGKSRPC